MFRGSIPQDMRSIVKEHVSGWSCQHIYVGCSGNFTVERVVNQAGGFGLHGNDVSLYSCALGSFLANQPIRIELKSDIPAGFEFLREYVASPEEVLATIMLLTNVAQTIDDDGATKEIAYYGRLLDSYKRHWKGLHEQTMENIKANTFWLDSFACEDVMTWIERVPKDQGIIAYPPFSGVGAVEQYQRETRRLELFFDWDKPAFTAFGDEDKVRFVTYLRDNFQYWITGSNRPIDELAPFLRGVMQRTNRGTKVYAYASTSPRRIVSPSQNVEAVPVPRLSPGDTIGDKMTLCVLKHGQFQTLRSLYMNIGIKPGAASLALAVLVDGKLIGSFAFSSAPKAQTVATLQRGYLLSDFPVEPTDYPRLSKLVLYAALSQESKLLLERLCNRRIREIQTTAYSNNPVSMKYRGLFDLHSRGENPTAQASWGANIDLATNPYYRRPYKLEYMAIMGQWDLQEGLRLWKKKHGKKGRK